MKFLCTFRFRPEVLLDGFKQHGRDEGRWQVAHQHLEMDPSTLGVLQPCGNSFRQSAVLRRRYRSTPYGGMQASIAPSDLAYDFPGCGLPRARR